MKRLRRGIVALIAISLLGLVGCEEEPPPEAGETTPSPWVSPSPSPSSEPSALNKKMTDREFIQIYLDAVVEALRSGDTGQLEVLGSPKCASCTALARGVAGKVAEGSRGEGIAWTVIDAKPLGERVRNQREWEVTVRAAAEQWYDGSGSLIEDVPEMVHKLRMTVGTHRSGEKILDGFRTNQ